jgi:hypothetical protein
LKIALWFASQLSMGGQRLSPKTMAAAMMLGSQIMAIAGLNKKTVHFLMVSVRLRISAPTGLDKAARYSLPQTSLIAPPGGAHNVFDDAGAR